MKTYLLNAVKRLKNYSQKLDANAVLYDKSWEVFNESGDKELMIFRTNKELLISRNGIVQKGTWELLDIANLIIDVGEKTYLFNTAYVEDEFLALKLDGTNEYMIMIETDMKNRFSLNSVKSIEGYLDNKYKKLEQVQIEEKAKIERKNREEQEKLKQQEKLRIEYLKENAEKRYKKGVNSNKVIISLIIINFIVIIAIFIFLNSEEAVFYTILIFIFPIVIFVIKFESFLQVKADYKEYLEIIEKEKINQENS